MYKFFIENDQIQDTYIEINGTDVNHIKNVLRLKIGEQIQACDTDSSKNYLTEITELDNEKVIVKILEEYRETTEPSIDLHIFQGIPKQEKMEWIIQKTTELGVNEITPVKMEHCVVKLDDKQEMKKIERWQKIAEVAAKQSKRDRIPKINSSVNIQNLCKKLIDYDIVLLAYEEEKTQMIKNVLKQVEKKENLKVAIIIGPEGGISKDEVEILKEMTNLKIVSLGSRILRTETAGMVLASILMYEFDEME